MNNPEPNKNFEKQAIEAAVKIGIVFLMIIWSFFILKPFLLPVLWGVIIAVAMNPFIVKLSDKMGGRLKLASVLFALVVVAALILPAVILVLSSVDSVQSFTKALEAGTIEVPPPPLKVQELPVIGPSLYETWSMARTNLTATLNQYGPEIREITLSILGSVGGLLKTVLMFVVSVIISAALIVTGDKGTAAVNKIANRLAGDKGAELVILSTATIRGVMKGVIGVASIQAALSAVGMLIVSVPAAGLWSLMVLLLAVMQLPPILILGPIAAWVFSAADTLPAVFFLVWAILVSASDGILKPMLMGRGVDIPMLVILLGALGGMILSGIIGLFVGAVVFAMSYSLFSSWVSEGDLKAEKDSASASE